MDTQRWADCSQGPVSTPVDSVSLEVWTGERLVQIIVVAEINDMIQVGTRSLYYVYYQKSTFLNRHFLHSSVKLVVGTH